MNQLTFTMAAYESTYLYNEGLASQFPTTFHRNNHKRQVHDRNGRLNHVDIFEHFGHRI